MTNIYNLFKFIENKEGYRTPFKYKILNDPSSITKDDLIVNGYLDLSNTPITSLPDNLTVKKDLSIYNTKLTSLPDNLKVGGDLYLSDIPITSFPDNLIVRGTLYLKDTPLYKKYTIDQLKQMLPGMKGAIHFYNIV